MDNTDFSLRNVSRDDQVKHGRYSGTMHWDVKGFGKSKWVVLGYIDIDWPYLEIRDSLTKEDIIDNCLQVLNQAPPRKKYQKKEPKPLYGVLEKYKADFVAGEKPHIVYQFVTDDSKNEFFLGEPPSVLTLKNK